MSNPLHMPAFATLIAAVAAVATVAAAGCAADAPPEPQWSNTEPPPCVLQRHWYQVDRVDAPGSRGEAKVFALDLDGDREGRPDNALGAIRSSMAAEGIDFDGPLDETLAAGNLGWYLAVDTCADGSFDYVAVHGSDGVGRARDLPAVGVIDADGRMMASGGVASAPIIAMFLVAPADAPVEWSPGVALTVDLTLREDGTLDGRYAIAFDTRGAAYVAFQDALAKQASLLVAGDPGCPAACVGSGAAYVSDAIDLNQDGLITGDEFRDDSLMRSLFSPDLDLIAVDDSGADVYRPNTDGVAEHLSLGVDIHAVPLD